MSKQIFKYKCTVAAFLAAVMYSLPAGAQDASAEQLLDELLNAEPAQAERIATRLINEWSKSGSPAMDLLLKRGRDALELSDHDAAIEHFQALTDHAPEFAEGWHALALAYYHSERYGPALDAIERALALNPQHFGAMRGLAAIMEQVGAPELAYKAYQKVLEINPQDAEVQQAVDRLGPLVSGTAL